MSLMFRFGRMPTWWQREENDFSLMASLRMNETGEGIAAMKCLLAIAVLLDYQTREADVSFSGLEDVTGLSRPMVSKGIQRLEELEVLSVDRSSYVSNYCLTHRKSDQRWAKVPVDMVRKNLSQIHNRGAAPFCALKIYLTLLGLRYKGSHDDSENIVR